ncbi:MAG TPA: response regulator transcription factor [Chloroflexota bacterium]|nr:response regulator transcription factor [Chloroflexota bacterium]
MAKPRILVVEDEAKISQIVAAYLRRDGYQVIQASDGREALELARSETPDLIVLDLMLPEISGWDVCRDLRRNPRTARVPIIMATAREDVSDRIVGLELGADDYVVKPYDAKELVARVHAVLRRVTEQREVGAFTQVTPVLQRGDLTIDRDRYEVRRAGEIIPLTRTEFAIVATLAAAPGRVFSRMQLLDSVQGEAFEGYERSIDSHVKNLRRKIEIDPRQPRYIATMIGVGYKFVE